MQFAKKLRTGVASGEITTSIRIWQNPRVKVNGCYKMGNGEVVVTSIKEIAFDDITEKMARDSGFLNRADLLKTAKHGKGIKVYYIQFYYQD